MHFTPICTVEIHLFFSLCRGEYYNERKALEQALHEAYAKGFLGKNACGSGYDFDLNIAYGAGAYICGESSCLYRCCQGAPCWVQCAYCHVAIAL